MAFILPFLFLFSFFPFLFKKNGKQVLLSLHIFFCLCPSFHEVLVPDNTHISHKICVDVRDSLHESLMKPPASLACESKDFTATLSHFPFFKLLRFPTFT